jgi:Uncharacterized protein conserved in bacteria
MILYLITALCIAIILLQILSLSQKKSGNDDYQFRILDSKLETLHRATKEEFEMNRRDTGMSQKDMREETAKNLEKMSEKLEDMNREINATLYRVRRDNDEQSEKQGRKIAESISKMQESNEKKLDQMRQTVDEKLTETLTKRLDSSFKTVSEQLEHVYKSLGEMKELSGGITTGISSLNRIMTNVKSRGTWAEVQLENILDQTIPGMYERNYAPRESSKERVEFAIRIPAGEDKQQMVYLPVDSKFPIEDYIRLCAAADSADAEATAQARKALEDHVLQQARTVQKYINVPVTTPYAVLYLATEGLYAEIAASRTGILERIQREFNVMIAGPTTITALLNSLSMGFRAVAINEKANEVRKLLASAKVQYDKFGVTLERAKKKIDEAGKTLTEAQSRNDIIRKRLRKVEEIDTAQADAFLDFSEDENLIEEQ